ncbi:hypothetical protein BU14_0457s0002 [Porphyra umbilicalis]|uniref:Uncharacterized protein n=1 Tax=Porphyra umbilicalis TaxID=2786 RepID=A0A1X6NUA6_PORUM|nr:hypothetical protein BU14_0457s0002 [Porphyra umbilicalis]|eukprot:OSX72209.1 hypothetical protein BU14_0457s0002 [Porphyra umbilicalis]
MAPGGPPPRPLPSATRPCGRLGAGGWRRRSPSGRWGPLLFGLDVRFEFGFCARAGRRRRPPAGRVGRGAAGHAGGGRVGGQRGVPRQHYQQQGGGGGAVPGRAGGARGRLYPPHAPRVGGVLGGGDGGGEPPVFDRVEVTEGGRGAVLLTVRTWGGGGCLDWDGVEGSGGEPPVLDGVERRGAGATCF